MDINANNAKKSPFIKRTLVQTMQAIIVVLCLANASSSAQESQNYSEDIEKKLQFLRIGTGAPDETLYRLGSALTGAISAPPGIKPACRPKYPCGVPGLLLVTQSRDGPFESISDMTNDTLESAIIPAEILHEVTDKNADIYRIDTSKLTIIARLATVQLHIIVRANSRFRHITDLQGSTIAIGQAGASYALQLHHAWRVASKRDAKGNASLDSAITINLPLQEAFDKLIEEKIDAIAITAQAPLPILQAFAQQNPIRLLEVNAKTNAQNKNGQQKHSSANEKLLHKGIARPASLPPEIYNGVDKQINTIEFDLWWVGAQKLSKQSVYQITRSLWHSSTKSMLQQIVPEAKIEKPRAIHLLKTMLPLHPGAAKWYQEQGLLAKE